MIAKTKIEAVLQEVDIIKIIGDYIPLQKRGRNYFAVCPFHDDKNPSMSINREKRIYKCFSCGAQGNAIKFLENYAHLSFLEALKTLASTTSIDLEADFSEINHPLEKFSPHQKLLFQINEEALQYFKVTLASKYGKAAMDYLEQRNLKAREIEIWELGFSHSKASLYNHLLKKGYTIEQLREVSLVNIKDKEILNYFNNRLMFPIRDLDGNLIGFSGRSLSANQNVKYLNTRETPIFKKSQLLFNINHAIKKINQTKKIIMTEGFMDVFSMSSIGFEQTVATMGTNFSDFHISILKKINATILLFFDGDEAGIKANLKAISKLMHHNLKVKIINNPTNYDPDELIKNGKIDLVKELVEHPLNAWDYAINKLRDKYNLDSFDHLKQFLDDIFGLLRINNDPIMINQVLKRLESITRINFDSLNQSYQQKNTNSTRFNLNYSEVPISKPIKTYQQTGPYREILGALARDINYIEIIQSNLDLIQKTICEKDINFVLVLKMLIQGYQTNTYQGKEWQELINVFNQVGFDYADDEWNFNPEWWATFPLEKNLTPAFLNLEERYWRQKENYYIQKINQTNDPITLKNYWLQQRNSRERLLNLRKKRTEWQWKK